jgi:hypothetical protein
MVLRTGASLFCVELKRGPAPALPAGRPGNDVFVFGNMNITYAPLSPPLSLSLKRERELSRERLSYRSREGVVVTTTTIAHAKMRG